MPVKYGSIGFGMMNSLNLHKGGMVRTHDEYILTMEAKISLSTITPLKYW